MTPSKILCLGDLHLGVRPSRLPSEADARSTSVAAVWRRAVEWAVGGGVGLVLLSGDVVDRANRYFEAFGPLEEGLRELAGAGIEVCAVAGNHDLEVLPRLTRVVGGERFHLLGRGGRWERFTWRGEDGRARLHVDGWSFPERDVSGDPVASYDLEAPVGRDAGAPVLGLVHGDLDQAASTNAPLSRARLEVAGPAAWLLGHIHKPSAIELAGGRWALYPGSPQPLDWSETGRHGAWIVELAGDRLGPPRMIPLATVRWERLDLDLWGAGDLAEVETRIGGAVRDEAARRLAESGGSPPEELLFRLTLTGRTPAHRELPELARRLEEETPLELRLADGGHARLMEVRVATRPALDLETLARGDDAAALVAGLVRELDLEGEERAVDAELVRRAGERLREVYDQRPYLALGDGLDPGEEEVLALLAARAADLLDALVAGRQGRGTAGDPEPGAAEAPGPPGEAQS